jgi:S-DNA-T family DNA segregation ATPase FtsK/SpoIIIE
VATKNNSPKKPVKGTNQQTGSEDAGLDQALQLIMRLRRFTWDVIGVLLLAFSLMTLLALLNVTRGVLLTPWAFFLRRWLGWGSYLLVVGIGIAGGMVLNPRTRDVSRIKWTRILALEIAALTALTFLSVFGGTSLDRAEAGLDGGQIGWGLAEFLGLFLGPSGRLGFLSFVFVWGILSGSGIGSWFLTWLYGRLEAATTRAEAIHTPTPVSVSPTKVTPDKVSQLEAPKRKRSTRLPPEFKKQFKVAQKEEAPATPPQRDERLPAFDLLVSEKSSRPDERNINLTAGLIEKTLSEFGIPAKVVGFQVGPTITQFAVEPGYVERPGNEGEASRQKVRVSQITALGRDLALALSADRLRVQAPVPGRPYVGIEVPNLRFTTVRLRPILESQAFYKIDSPLAIALGRDVSGDPVVADLASMPHLLIAGATGSGKSVCIAAITTSLVMNNTPADLRIVMIDPKMVELVRFNGLPHLYGKVETDLERILSVLRWTVMEMDQRYKLLEELRARDIDAYNRKIRRRKGGETLPRIVVLIDELADLMMSAADQTEHTLVRLAQMARATGIHLVLATQRPSTDVVTGLIKANFPARMSFAVASSIDSRVILDTQGAESLLGRGDMLFLPPDAPSPMRAQGVMVADLEVEQVIDYWEKNWVGDQEEMPPWETVILEEIAELKRDALVERAIEVVRQSQRASASMLQRRLRIGYPRAARLIDQLEEIGVVGPSMGPGREREVLIGFEEDDV